MEDDEDTDGAGDGDGFGTGTGAVGARVTLDELAAPATSSPSLSSRPPRAAVPVRDESSRVESELWSELEDELCTISILLLAGIVDDDDTKVVLVLLLAVVVKVAEDEEAKELEEEAPLTPSVSKLSWLLNLCTGTCEEEVLVNNA